MPDPKLTHAGCKIGEILKSMDIAGVVLLASPGEGEDQCFLETSWSCIARDTEGKHHFRAVREEYADPEKLAGLLNNTFGMCSMFHEMARKIEEGFEETLRRIGREYDVVGYVREEPRLEPPEMQEVAFLAPLARDYLSRRGPGVEKQPRYNECLAQVIDVMLFYRETIAVRKT